LDLLLAGEHQLALFRQQEDGTFQEVSQRVGLKRRDFWQGCAVGDLDNDGDPDIVLAGYETIALYRNQGGTFIDATHRAALNPSGWNSCVALGDVNRDGWLDLFVGRYVDFGPHTIQYCLHRGILTTCGPRPYDPQFGTLYRNNGDGTFTDVTRAWGLRDAHGKALGAAFCDFDDDGWIDLYVANDEMPCDLYRNEGGRLRNVGLESGTAFTFEGNTQAGMGVDWGDFDRDGRLDLVVGTYQKEVVSLYRNLGNGTFQEESMMRGLGEPTFPHVVFTVKFFDYDHDGWLDLLAANGHTQSNIKEVDFSTDYPQPQQLFHNRGDGTFEEVSQRVPAFARPIVGRGAAFGDFDDDGDLDVALVNLEGEAWLLENVALKRGHWLRIRLVGKRSNRDGLNARLNLWAGGRRFVLEAQTGGGFFSSHDPWVHVGLGPAERVERLEVRWPSGHQDVFMNVPVDAKILLREGGSHGASAS